jgi:hypothetical protein
MCSSTCGSRAVSGTRRHAMERQVEATSAAVGEGQWLPVVPSLLQELPMMGCEASSSE